MTDDKDFKRLVRQEAKRRGVTYTAARKLLEQDSDAPDLRAALRVAVDRLAVRFYGATDALEIVVASVVAGVPLLFTDPPGTGMTALARGVADLVHGRLVAVQGTPDTPPDALPAASPGDVLLIGNIDMLPPRAQEAVLHEVDVRAVTVLAKRGAGTDAPHPLSDSMLDRFGAGLSLGFPEPAAELALIGEFVGDAHQAESSEDAVADVRLLRGSLDQVSVPNGVRQFLVAVMNALRATSGIGRGASVNATAALIALAPVFAAKEGRGTVEESDIEKLLPFVLGHRLAPAAPLSIEGVLEACVATARDSAR